MSISGKSNDVIDGVVCSVENCVYHTNGNRCSADTIAVRMENDRPTKKDETLCSTFENQNNQMS
jgi:hypothetical protein